MKAAGYGVIGMAALEDPEIILLMQADNLKSLGKYPPFTEPPKNSLVTGCLNFRVFSLHRLLKGISLRVESVLVPAKPYCSYAIDEVDPESEAVFEGAIAKRTRLQNEKANWCVWKAFFAGDCPKYVFCSSFATKEEMQDWSFEKALDEAEMKNILRGKKTGFAKRQSEFCFP